MMSDPLIPRWLIDDTSSLNEVFAVHTQPPRFIARLRYQAFDEVPPPAIGIENGWLAVPLHWIDAYDAETWNSEEIKESLNAAWKQFDRDNH